MPNEPVQCPSCGSGDVYQQGCDFYRCNHCQTGFERVVSYKIVDASKPSVCACGNVAVAFCVRCHEPLCERHKSGGRDRDQDQTCEEIFMDLFMHFDLDGAVVRQAMIKHGLPDYRDKVVCRKCKTEYYTSLKAILEAQAKPCAVCSERTCEQCAICKAWICLRHVNRCGRCGQWVCNQHKVVNGLCTKCGPPPLPPVKTAQASSWINKLLGK
jgi:hypothetical protein